MSPAGSSGKIEKCKCEDNSEDHGDGHNHRVKLVEIETDEEMPAMVSNNDSDEENDSIVYADKSESDSIMSNEVAGDVTESESTAIANS